MKKNCQYCTKTRTNLLFVFVAVLLANAVGRAYMGFPLENIEDIKLLPSATTLAFALLALIFKYTKQRS